MQVHEQLPVAEPVVHPVRKVHGQRRLTSAGHPDDHDQPGLGPVVDHYSLHMCKFTIAPDEAT
ncbi:hypothetical protein [Catenulispora rubra]|uniref:hypothetical protein n=1 Tax=Catenulispora rubra TaxID=280293 RepID=UPI00226488E5|nr:hypothetical protein [Catenulispora rubra]